MKLPKHLPRFEDLMVEHDDFDIEDLENMPGSKRKVYIAS